MQTENTPQNKHEEHPPKAETKSTNEWNEPVQLSWLQEKVLQIGQFKLVMAFGLVFSVVAILMVVVLAGSPPHNKMAYQAAEPTLPEQDPDGPITPLKPFENLNPQVVALGKQLFFDKRLSADNTLSCASCHNMQKGGADGMPVSVGINSRLGFINAPTVINSALNVRQFWDGRAATLEEQVAGPIHNVVEMGSNWQQVIGKLQADPQMVKLFKKVFQAPIQAENIAFAIATFERSLMSLNSPFDQWLQGDESALSDSAIRGYKIFSEYGCISCHQGAAVGGGVFETMGTLKDYFADLDRPITNADLGRFNVSKSEVQRYEFKVPSLRVAAHTAPYFHDGSVPTLEQAVFKMAWYQLGVELPDEDVMDITAFIQSLSGTVNLQGEAS